MYAKKDKSFDVVDRPLTSFLSTNQYKFSRNNQMREIQDIKDRLVRNKVNIPVRKIQSALMVPFSQPDTAKDPSKIKLPAPGSMLAKNPVMKKKKRRKGKKKRRAK